MKNKKISFLFLWLIPFAISIMALFLLPSRITEVIYIAFIFDILAFFAIFVVCYRVGLNIKTQASMFIDSPTILLSITYMLITIIMSIIVGLFSSVVKTKTIVIWSLLFLSFYLCLILMLFISKNNAKRIDARQRNNHKDLMKGEEIKYL